MIIIILLLVSLGHLATDIYLPSLPAIADYFKVSISAVQITISLYLVSMSISPLVFGPLSDAIGRKKVIIMGIILGIIATLFCGLAPNIYVFMFGRVLQGVAIGAIIIAARAMVPDLYSGKEMATKITYVVMLKPLILSIAPLIGGYIQEYSQWRMVFLFLILYFLMLLIPIPRMTETLQQMTKRKLHLQNPFVIASFYKKTINNLPFMIYGMCSVIPIIGLFAYLTISPFLFQNILGLSPSEYGVLSLYIGCSIMISGYINTVLIRIFSFNVLLFISAAIVMTSGLLLLLFTCLGLKTVIWILLPILLYFFCITIGVANATSKALTYLDGEYGTARALLTTCQFLAGALGSFIFSMIPSIDGFYLAICFIINSILIFLCVLMAQKITKTIDGATSINNI